MTSTKPSIVEYFYKLEGPEPHRCGYCKSDNTSISNGMWAHQLTCQDYNDLIDRGWRRSGKYCHKPIMNRTCCPLYTIKCDATSFQMSKSQKTVMKKVNRYLELGSTKLPETLSASKQPTEVIEDSSVKPVKTVKPGVGQDPDKPPCRKAKEVRRERKMEKLKSQESQSSAGATAKPPQKESTAQVLKKSVEDFLPDLAKNKAHKLEVKLIQSTPQSSEFKATFKESYALYSKYQMAVHNDKPSDCTEQQFVRFLVDSPLIPSKNATGSIEFGSFHQHYYINGKLIMVGVVDMLPNCLSSVYIYYDPDFMFISPGVYSALSEIAAVRRLQKKDPSFQYYYMGFYVHSCPKMNYKGQYTPSFLACPETYNWVPIEKCKVKLDANKYSRLEENPQVKPIAVDSYIEQALVLYEQQCMPYEVFKAFCQRDKSHKKIKEYAELVGKDVSHRMILYVEE